MKIIAFIILIFTSSCLPLGNKSKVGKNNTDCYFPGLVESRPLQYKDCGLIDSKGNLSIKKSVLQKIKFDEDGLANGVFNSYYGCYWLNKQGVLMKSSCAGPFAADFYDGLTVHINSQGLYGYMDKKLNIIINPKYDWGTRFNYKHARVCNGCKSVRHKGSEHSFMEGGQWKVINLSGAVVNQCLGAENNSNCKIPSY